MKKLITILAIVCVTACASQAITISDNFDDQVIGDGPGSWSGDIDIDPGWNADGTGAWGAEVGSAASDDAGKQMTLDFGGLYTYAEVEFDVMQPNGTGASYRLEWGFMTDTAKEWFTMENSPEEWRYGGVTSIASYDGNHNIVVDGDVEQGNRLPRSGWQHFKLVFDIAEYKTIKVYADDEGDGTMELVAQMENLIGDMATGVTGFRWSNRDGAVTWNIDNVAVNAVPEPATLGLLAIGGFIIRRKK